LFVKLKATGAARGGKGELVPILHNAP